MSSSEVRLIQATTEDKILWWDNNACDWTDNIKRAMKIGSGWASQHEGLFKYLYRDGSDKGMAVQIVSAKVDGNKILDTSLFSINK